MLVSEDVACNNSILNQRSHSLLTGNLDFYNTYVDADIDVDVDVDADADLDIDGDGVTSNECYGTAC